jgi:hypothetical protein
MFLVTPKFIFIMYPQNNENEKWRAFQFTFYALLMLFSTDLFSLARAFSLQKHHDGELLESSTML